MSLEHDRISGQQSLRRPGWSGRWASGPVPLLDSATGSESRDSALSEDLDALSSLSPWLAEAVASSSWMKLLDAPLLAGHDEDTMDLEHRERLLAEKLPSIAHVTRRFVMRLGERAELLPVVRVKRPARRALERLAAHTEDWAGRTLAGPVPRRALAVTREEEADLYENRMVTELIHPILSSTLLARIRKLRRLVSDLADLDPAQHVGTYQRTERLYSFWGEDAAKAAESHVHAARTLKVLEELAAWVQALRGSGLSRALEGKLTGRRSLRRTNIIANDRHYRAAGELWISYERPEVASESPEDKQHRLSSRHRAFDHYVLGLVVRALSDLGYAPRLDSLPGLGERLELEGTWGTINLRRDLEGVLTLDSRRTQTRLVPLLDLVGPDDDQVTIGGRWAELQDVVRVPTVVVYLAASASIRNGLDQKLAEAMSSAKDDALVAGRLLSGVPVSPLETTSLERVARGISLAVHIPPLMAYPPTITVGEGPMPRRLVDHLASADIGQANLAPLFDHVGKELRLRRPCSLTEELKLQAVIAELADAVRGRGWQRDLGDHISQLKASFEKATTSLRPLLTCPVCSVPADTKQVLRAGDVFMIECSACASRWGHERCGNCQGRIPIIEPDGAVVNAEITGPGWVERIFGRDALASPCWARGVTNRYICPHCRTCPLAAQSTDTVCQRCH